MSRPMGCELELDNVDRLANVISQKVVQMVEPSAWPNLPYSVLARGLEWYYVWLASKKLGALKRLCMSIDMHGRGYTKS
jgi:hypothetical protein